jgi:transposase-like protein
VRRFAPLLADAARFARHSPGERWFVDETYVKINGRWCYLYRAVDQQGQVIDVLVSVRRDAVAARRFFTRALRTLKFIPSEVVLAGTSRRSSVRFLPCGLPAAVGYRLDWWHANAYPNRQVVTAARTLPVVVHLLRQYTRRDWLDPLSPQSC